MAWRSVRPSRDERVRLLPGDELIPNPIGVLMHAITIRRPPADVWPWLVQMGGGRAGWYSYDWIDNSRVPSAERVRPELQAISVGAVFPALPGRTDGFVVASYETELSLVLAWRQPDGSSIMTWAFVLTPLGQGWTRLLVRARGAATYSFRGLPRGLSMLLIRPIHFVMQRRQLLGLTRRIEGPALRRHPIVRVAAMMTSLAWPSGSRLW